MVGKAQKSGDWDEKEKGARRPSSPQFPPLFVFTVYAQHIFVVVGSLFLNIRFHSIWTIEKKKEVREEEKSSSTVGVFVILDNVSSSPSWSPEKRRLVHNRKSSVQMYCSFDELIS